MNTLFKNARILQQDGIAEGCLGVSGKMIAFVGDIPESFAAERVIDCQRNLLMPGLVNTHTHLPMVLFRSIADDMELHQWLTERIFPMEDMLSEDDAYWGTLLAQAELIRGGVTCFNEMYMFPDTIIDVTEMTGLRGVIARIIVDGQADQRARLACEQKQRTDQFDRIKTSVSIHAEYTTVSQTVSKAVETAKLLDVPMHFHASETFSEHEECKERHNGLTPIAYFNSLDALGPKSLAAHCVHATVEDIALLASTHTTVAHCPQSNLKLASGVAPLPVMLANRCSVSLGTDGAASNNNLDMFEEMRLAATLHKGVTFSPRAVDASQALALATVTGARALGFNAGLLEKGRLADIIMLDTAAPHMLPTVNLSNVVYSAGASDVVMTMVNGRILYEKGQYYTIDMERLQSQISRISEKYS